MEFLKTILVLYGSIALSLSTFQLWRMMVLGEENGKFLNYLPGEIYKRTKLNWFGVILLFIGEILIIPLYWLTMIIVCIICGIIYGLNWLIHVGRKKDDIS